MTRISFLLSAIAAVLATGCSVAPISAPGTDPPECKRARERVLLCDETPDDSDCADLGNAVSLAESERCASSSGRADGVQGTRRIGQACAHSSQCVSGLACRRPPDDLATFARYCLVPAKYGEACAGSHECRAEDGTVCLAENVEGEALTLRCGPCTRTDECPDGKVCRLLPEGYKGCGASLARGEYCAANDECASGVCEGEACAPAPCETIDDCRDGQACRHDDEGWGTKVCQELGRQGSFCRNEADCDGLRCIPASGINYEFRICAPPGGRLARCDNHSDCELLLDCYADACHRRPPEGWGPPVHRYNPNEGT